MQAVHLAYTEAQNSSQEPQLISATCTFHKMEHITHDHRWNIAIQCLLKSLYVNVFVCNCLYISFTRANRNLAETNISGVKFGIPFLFWITLSIIVFLGALSKNAIVSLLPLFPQAETLIMQIKKSFLYIENAFHINNITLALLSYFYTHVENCDSILLHICWSDYTNKWFWLSCDSHGLWISPYEYQ